MKLPPFIQQLENKLEGEPEQFITMAMIITALVLLFVAFRGTRTVKLVVLAWVLFP